MGTRTLIVDFKRGTGDEPFYGYVTIHKTRVLENGTFELLPWSTKVKLRDGIATFENAVTDGSGPIFTSAYRIVAEDICGNRAGVMVPLPDGTTPVRVSELPHVSLVTGDGSFVDIDELNALIQQANDTANQAEAIAQSVRDDADAGLFKGDPGGWTTTYLPATADPDTLRTPAIYAFNELTTHKGKLPRGASGVIKVYSRQPANDRIFQDFYPNMPTSGVKVIFRRFYTGSAWSGWDCYSSTRIDKTVGTAVYQWDWEANREIQISGDTGMRTLTPATGTAGAFNIRRVGSQVEIRVVGYASSTGGNILTAQLPNGWRPQNTITAYGFSSVGDKLVKANLSFDGSSLNIEGITSASGTVSFLIQYLTSNPWPSVAP